jgi:FlaG/FlaF family flagellin (archaellin)
MAAEKIGRFTRREKVIGVLVIGFVVLSGGIASAIGGGGSQPAVVPTPAVAQPVVTYQEKMETEAIPFQAISRDDPTKSSGSHTVTTQGVNGEKVKTFKLKLVDGVEQSRELVSEKVTKEPIDEVTSVGTYVAPVKKTSSNCDPNYSGKCVPIASDVDCSGGSGNGPAYVSGPVYVVGSDIYDLDRDGNGVGCE